ncbi:hypothetical protein F5Y16DRAFT_422614 [Xylariaceae sp. FL0255]|nr:hypothetical protein F5Y16DRAFT_422614 [Xylariaceae sp. FL0255]
MWCNQVPTIRLSQPLIRLPIKRPASQSSQVDRVMALRTPPLLEAHLRLPHETSLILLSGVLGSSTNWLVHRYLYSLLASAPSSTSDAASSLSGLERQHGDESVKTHTAVSVVLVSFLRDYGFWKEGSRRLGLDLDLAIKKRSFAFVDGLTGLFVPATGNGSTQIPGIRVLTAATTENFRRTVENAVVEVQRGVPETQTLIIIDQPDLLLAASSEAVSSQSLRDAIMDLREKVHSCIITVSADEPLISAHSSTLEKEHASLALSLAHDADLIISLRNLETGVAKDVSGVLRITPGGDNDETGTAIEERELLYHIGGDGGVRVFGRGQ